MPSKPHLYFKNPQEGLVEYRQRPGGGSSNEEIEEEVNYTPMADQFEFSKNRFINDQRVRNNNRTIEIPIHFDLIEIEFQNYFDQRTFEQAYFNDFGLSLVHLTKFNRLGLFIINDSERFRSFFGHLDTFIRNVRERQNAEYDGKIKYIRRFKLYTSRDMITHVDNYSILHFTLLNHQLHYNEWIKPQKELLEIYLNRKNIQYNIDESILEIYNSTEVILNEILNNFDLIYATCSGSGAIIRPDPFNIPEREFGFTVIEDNIQDLPIIGIIDTGVSNQTPLTPILINPGLEFDLTNSGLFFDFADHGTGVATLAAFGSRLIPNYRGEIESDARILPIKIINNQEFPLSQKSIIDLIRRAHVDYGVKIFTLTIGYGKFPLFDNEEISSYAAMLDELAFELDILIFISTTNNCNNINDESEYPQKFLDEDSNIAPPSESMNNITVGANADNFQNGDFVRRSGISDYPAIYSRKYHYNFCDDEIFNNTNKNKHLLKPDILMPGGDYWKKR
jgi:hypothetical protein